MKQKNSKYSVWENAAYVIAGIWKWQPLALVLTILHGLMQGLSAYVWLYAVKWIIEIFQRETDAADKIEQMFMLVGILSAAELVMLVISNLSDKGGEGRMHDVEYRFAQFGSPRFGRCPFLCMRILTYRIIYSKPEEQ